jgi:hypothetical protein
MTIFNQVHLYPFAEKAIFLRLLRNVSRQRRDKALAALFTCRSGRQS